MAKVKGLAFRSVVRTLDQLRGPETVDLLYQHLMPALRDDLRWGRMVSGGWYPVEDYRAVLAGIAKIESAGLIKEVGAAAIRADLNAVHKVILRMLNPGTIVQLSAGLFSKYYDTGVLRSEKTSKTSARASYEGCDGFDRNMWLEVLGSTEEVLAISGAKHVRIRISSGGGDRDPHCTMDVYWSESEQSSKTLV